MNKRSKHWEFANAAVRCIAAAAVTADCVMLLSCLLVCLRAEPRSIAVDNMVSEINESQGILNPGKNRGRYYILCDRGGLELQNSYD